MAKADEPVETILIVDDEEPVRRTFQEWLEGAGLGCQVLAAPDAERALDLANRAAIDLAVLDWHLGAGDDGLQLLQDLYAFHPNVIAIMVTGYANQATPLDAMRMGVRDYLDKNHDLSRETFLQAVKKQLALIRPAKRARSLQQSLLAFRQAVEKILPLVQSAAALNDPVPLPDAIRGLMRFLIQVTEAKDGVLLVRHYDSTKTPAETIRVYDSGGKNLEVTLLPFARSVAGTVISLQQAAVSNDLQKATWAFDLQPFEKGRRCVLAAHLPVASGLQAVLELFDKPDGFTPNDQLLASAAAELGADLLRQALGRKQTEQLLIDSVSAALAASEHVSQSLGGAVERPLEQPPPEQVLDQLRQGLRAAAGDDAHADLSLRMAEAIRVLARRHGRPALEHCLTLIDNVGRLLDKATGN
ncbi:MAG: response regulator [Gemmataceae bacterium]|nr:response regulator [Gemmataceae bacterium]